MHNYHTCLPIAFQKGHPPCHLGSERVHADDLLEAPRVGIEQMREGREDLALRGSYQRLADWVEALVPSGRSEERRVIEVSPFQGQIIGQLPILYEDVCGVQCYSVFEVTNEVSLEGGERGKVLLPRGSAPR